MSELYGERGDGVRGLTPSEVEFFAEDTLVTVVPRLAMPTLHLVAGDFGPFRPPEPATVPLWLAVTMKRVGWCSVRAPAWLAAEALEGKFEEENGEATLAPMPFHFQEVASLLLHHAPGDVAADGDLPRLRTALENLLNLRQNKLRRGLQQVRQRTEIIKLNNIGAMEANATRPLLKGVLEPMYELERRGDDDEDDVVADEDDEDEGEEDEDEGEEDDVEAAAEDGSLARSNDARARRRTRRPTALNNTTTTTTTMQRLPSNVHADDGEDEDEDHTPFSPSSSSPPPPPPPTRVLVRGAAGAHRLHHRHHHHDDHDDDDDDDDDDNHQGAQ